MVTPCDYCPCELYWQEFINCVFSEVAWEPSSNFWWTQDTKYSITFWWHNMASNRFFKSSVYFLVWDWIFSLGIKFAFQKTLSYLIFIWFLVMLMAWKSEMQNASLWKMEVDSTSIDLKKRNQWISIISNISNFDFQGQWKPINISCADENKNLALFWPKFGNISSNKWTKYWVCICTNYTPTFTVSDVDMNV